MKALRGAPRGGGESMRWVGRAVAGAGASIPALLWFTGHEPPLFVVTGILTTALGGAVIVLGQRKGVRTQKDLKWAIGWVIIALLLVSVYGMSLDYLSSTAPSGWNRRVQIGFYKADWSLTARGLVIKEKHPDEPPARWILATGDFSNEAVRTIWKPFGIFAAGLTLVMLFMGGFCLWAYGFARIDKWLARNQASVSGRGQNPPGGEGGQPRSLAQDVNATDKPKEEISGGRSGK